MRSLVQYDSNANDDFLKLIKEFVLLPHIKAHEVIHVNYLNVTMSICTYIYIYLKIIYFMKCVPFICCL